ncbi:MAG TPA: phosphotransferase [Myxococcota bacterium]|nr:phosphotransferase [Myxococcota bacterium]
MDQVNQVARAFDALDKAQQTARCEAIARTAFGAWGDSLGPLSLLSDGFNTTFLGDSDRGRVVIRIHRRDHRGDNGLLVEKRWTDELRAQGLRVPEVLPTREGAPFLEWRSGDSTEPQHVSVIAYRDGKVLSESLTGGADESAILPHLAELGALAATLHGHTEAHHELDHLAPRHLAPLGVSAPFLTEAHLDPSLWALYSDALTRCEAVFALQTAPLQLCHADLHGGNVLLTGDGVALIDFDDCAVTWPGLDLGIAAFYLRVMPFGAERPAPDAAAFADRLSAFRAGYESQRPWPVSDRELAVFIVARQLSLLNLLAQERDPDRRAAFTSYRERTRTRLGAWRDEGLWP